METVAETRLMHLLRKKKGAAIQTLLTENPNININFCEILPYTRTYLIHQACVAGSWILSMLLKYPGIDVNVSVFFSFLID